jgi:hypothetical protein
VLEPRQLFDFVDKTLANWQIVFKKQLPITNNTTIYVIQGYRHNEIDDVAVLSYDAAYIVRKTRRFGIS